MAKDGNKEGIKQKRSAPIKQVDVPSVPLDQALRVPRAIADNYAAQPTTPLNVAAALDVQPTSGPFKMLCGASIAYGLTSGGYNAAQIEVTALGRRIVRPTKEGDDLLAKREATLKPRIPGEFLRRYDGSPLPNQTIAVNVLEELGVPRERASEALKLILDSARGVGLLKQIKDRDYVDLSGAPKAAVSQADETLSLSEEAQEDVTPDFQPPPPTSGPPLLEDLAHRKKRVFVAHGKNKSFLDPIRKLLAFGELDAVVSTEKQTVSTPVTDKVLEDMRSCGAAIIHIDAERVLMDKDASEHIVLNENVLIEVGASLALYGRRFILLVREGIRLPSNLQGLYEVRYEGETLDGNATLKLLEAINDIKNHPLPSESPSN